MTEELVILVDQQDIELGTMEKMQAHRLGALHRAFSIFLFHPNGQMLLQRRASEKYHSAGLWTNTCCSHPRPEESNIDAAKRRLLEEMGMQAEIQHAFSFIYRAELEHDLIEHELDHVFIGITAQEPAINITEVQDWCWMDTDELVSEVEKNPANFTPWFRIALPQVLEWQLKMEKN